ncbi:fibronectin type III domain-containing protein [Nocardioides carbamazepini]|uniref:fibronectin type III domain-containing protein n=1 Tax=Nocardioides carbamazepini TaxID=2854259 RepID=UPI00214A871C|nr:fibronectin type III domain-containing protein [Nocardioides carbamazepini]MCR1783932.1 fibronectin type III domain-containing protein [Nocardioides carbamazepini]
MTSSDRQPRSRWHRPKRPAIVVGGLALAIAAGAGIVYAAGGLAPPAVDPKTVHAPLVVPDRIVLTPTEDPSTSQSVSWRTSTAAGAPKVQLTLAGTGVAKETSEIEATSTTFTADLGYEVSHHSATLTGLTPGTTYLYRVGDKTTWSEWLEFETATAGDEPFSFIVQGDAQNDIKSYVSRTFRAAYEARPYAKAVLHAGDLIDTDDSDAEWGEWFGAAGWSNGSMNVVAATGNHEYYPGPELAEHWGAQFEYPRNGPTATDRITQLYAENVYYTDYQGVRFIALNSNFPGDPEAFAAQTAWLESVLADNPNQWTVVTFHHPVFSVSSGRNNAAIRDAWLPLFEQYDVDLVAQGHDHAYGRGNLTANESGLPAGASAATSHTGPVYLVSVAGPKYYVIDPTDDNNWTQNGAHLRTSLANTQLYQLVDVTDGEMHVESWNVSGEMVDAFTIAKGTDGTKLVTTDDTPRASGPGSTRDGIGRPDLPEAAVPGAKPTENPTEHPTVPPTSQQPTTPAQAVATLKLKKLPKQVRPGVRAKVKVVVDVPGITTPGATVTLVVDGRTVKVKQLRDAADGRLTLRLPRLAVGKHKVRVVYAGTAAVASATVTKTVVSKR